MGDSLFRADGHSPSAIGIKFDVKTAAIPFANCTAKARDSSRNRIAMRARPLYRLHQFVDDMRWGRSVRISHAEIDDVLAAFACRDLEFTDDVKDIRWQPADSVELGHDWWITSLTRTAAQSGSTDFAGFEAVAPIC